MFGGDRRVHPRLIPASIHPLPREELSLGQAQGSHSQPGRKHSPWEANKAHAEELMPRLAGVRSDRNWAGLMPFSLDGKPFIGDATGAGRLYVIAGLASHGFMRGPEAGRMLADLIHCGEAPRHPGWASLRPGRGQPPTK